MASSKKTTKGSNINKLRIRVQAYEPKVLDASVKQIIETATRLETTIAGTDTTPNKDKKVFGKQGFVHIQIFSGTI